MTVGDSLRDGDRPAAAALAREILRRRKLAGLSQPELAAMIGYTKQYISLAERSSSDLRSRELVSAIDSALSANGELLAMWTEAHREKLARRARQAEMLPRTRSIASPSIATVVAQRLPVLRRALDLHDMPDDGPVRPTEQLREAVRAAVQHRLSSNYGCLAHDLPQLIAELSRARLLQIGSRREQMGRLLLQTYRAADAIADKYGYFDLSARIIELMRTIANEIDDPLLMAMTAYVKTEVFFASGDLESGRTLLERAASTLNPNMSIHAAATYGALHMRAAVAAGKAQPDRPELANTHLAEATSVARYLDDGVYLGTAFGPSSVRIHKLSLAVELKDIDAALLTARDWRPPRITPAERRSHFYIDLARAHLAVRDQDAAEEALILAQSIAPETTSSHPTVLQMLAQLDA